VADVGGVAIVSCAAVVAVVDSDVRVGGVCVAGGGVGGVDVSDITGV